MTFLVPFPVTLANIDPETQTDADRAAVDAYNAEHFNADDHDCRTHDA